MKHSSFSSLSVSALLLGTLTLVGCGAALTSSNTGSADKPPTSPTAPQVVAGVPIKGAVYGGHDPIQGAHVYLLQPGITGYGSQATSLITSGTQNTSDPNVPTTNPAPQYVVTDTNGAFNTGDFTCVVGQPAYLYAWGGDFGKGTVFNENIVQLATLGNCPTSGNFYTAGNGALQYIYLNEVSTVATAYTFQPFTSATNNNAWDIGTSDTTQGLLGIANAANTAAQLYNIQGDGQTSSGAPDGEGHLANFATQGGNGLVPQATLDSLANILADCVDSVPATLGTVTSQCAALFKIATNNGETGTTTTPTNEPTDTGTAAINIARFPAGNNSEPAADVDATYAADIWALQGSGTTPYVPQLTTAPHDWTVAIYYPVKSPTPVYGTATNSTLTSAESIAIDDLGQIWISAQDYYIDRFSNLGATGNGPPAEPSDYRGYIPGYVSVDGQNNAWTGNANCNSTNPLCPGGTSIFQAGNNGVFNTTYGSGYQNAYTILTNNAGDAFFFANTATAPNYAMYEYGPNGATISGSPFNINGTANTTTTPTPTTGTQPITINAASETNAGGDYTYTFNFTYTANPTLDAVLAVGDTVPLVLKNDPGTASGTGRNSIPAVPATGWQNLMSVTVASVNNATNPTSFTATGNIPTTNSNDANGATTTPAIDITSATETHTNGGNPTYTYTFDFTNVGGTPGTVLKVGDTVPLALTNDPGTANPAVPATGWGSLTQVTVATVNNTANPTSFTATGTASVTKNAVTTNTVSADPNGPTVALNITGVTVAHAGGTYTYTFAATNTNAAPLAAGDTVTLALNNIGLGNWAGLNGSYTVVSPTTSSHFVVTSTTDAGSTAFFGGGTGTYHINGATGTGSYPSYINANGAMGTGSYNYVYDVPVTTTTYTGIPAGVNVAHGAIDHDGDLWVTAETPGNTIARLGPTGTPIFPSIVTAEQPEFPAIDNSGNAWIAIQSTPSQIYVITPGGGQTILTSASTGAALTSTFGAAVDGNGNVWFANRCGNYGGCDSPAITGDSSIVVINGGGSDTPGTAQKAISPSTNYIPEAQYPADGGTESPILNGPLNLAIDSSGNLWITNYTGGGIVEMVGAAAPVETPLSVAAADDKLGAKP